jgi:hypothetical protein
MELPLFLLIPFLIILNFVIVYFGAKHLPNPEVALSKVQRDIGLLRKELEDLRMKIDSAPGAVSNAPSEGAAPRAPKSRTFAAQRISQARR